MATIPSVEITEDIAKGVTSDSAFGVTLILGVPVPASYHFISDKFDDNTNGATNTEAQFDITINEGGKGKSNYTAKDSKGKDIKDKDKDISWSQTSNGKITVFLGTDTQSGADLPRITLTPQDTSFVKFTSEDGVAYTNQLKTESISDFIVTRDSYKEDMEKAGFESGSEEIKMATSFFSQSASKNQVVVARKAPSVGLTEFLQGITQNFYSFVISSMDDEDLLKESASFASTNKKIFLGRYTSPSNIKEEYNNDRAFFICHQDATTRVDCSFAGQFFGSTVGTNSKFVELSGEKINTFSSTNLNTLASKNINWYQYEGFNYVANGVCSDGTFLDERYAIDYIEDQIRTDLLSLIRKHSKIPYDSTGEAMLSGTIRGTLIRLATTDGLIANVSSSDSVSDLSDNGKWGFIIVSIEMVNASEDNKTKKHAVIQLQITLAGNLKSVEIPITFNL